MTYIGVGRRAVALIIDALLLVVVDVPIVALTGSFAARPEPYLGPEGPMPTSGTHGFYIYLGSGLMLLSVLLWFAYMTLSEAKGATLGKLAVGIRVRKEDGSAMDLEASLIRNVFRLIDGIFAYLVGAISVWTSPLRQRLGDRVAHTVVVPKEMVGMAPPEPARPDAAWSPPPVPPPPPPVG